MTNSTHNPVMPTEVIEFLSASKGTKFLDCTFGGGGHSKLILSALDSNALWAVDQDPDSYTRAIELNREYSDRFHFYQMNFRNIDQLKTTFDGILFDLGLSSFQIDSQTRGFSFKFHSKLDMRMDNQSGITAHEFLESASMDELIKAVKDYGEERFWKRVVMAIIKQRGTDVLVYSDSFADMLRKIIPHLPYTRIHPATKTFQGIRIAINNELETLETAIEKAFNMLNNHGRLVVISFHSLEDRIVKNFFKKVSDQTAVNTKHQAKGESHYYAKLLTKKPIVPSEKEQKNNPRSRSAKLRAIEKREI
ncbi:MAG: 16S rRNA (cytosine(1402)-N(4))-methyltransferase RsmH [Puniceicoccales bacterium]|jgi:16S rRNA (cytosine1402-N4)-methyltransferase|nr:16S rRNA (cytosine(1402)-N(4))-methyltransferase RsmH [Puniceicoccales bacterium]